jgi:hypothetical protein
MTCPDTPNPAPAAAGNPGSKIEQLGGELYNQNSPTLIDIQARRLAVRFGLAYVMALAVSALAFAVAR